MDPQPMVENPQSADQILSRRARLDKIYKERRDQLYKESNVKVIDPKMIIANNSLTVNQKFKYDEDNGKIGSGSFCTVYQATRTGKYHRFLSSSLFKGCSE